MYFTQAGFGMIDTYATDWGSVDGQIRSMIMIVSNT